MRIGLYCRESSDDTTKAPPIENQIEAGTQWAKENNHEIVIIYKDNGYSGGDWKRPDWNQCVKDAKRHFIQLIWTWDQDRLARDTEQFLWFYRNINQARVKIFEHTSNDIIDMESLGGRVKHQSLAQAGEIFRLVTSDKVKKAYNRKMIKGESWGRPKKDFDVNLAKKFRDEGKGWREIGKLLGVSYQTVRRVLLNTHTEI